jgi:hypothetical protein
MLSATDFLPLTIKWLMNLASVIFPNLGSGRISRFAATRLLGMDKPSINRLKGLQVTQAIKPALTLIVSV